MRNSIANARLAEYITALLLKPELLEQEGDSPKHDRFVEAIGDVVADFYGANQTSELRAEQRHEIHQLLFSHYLTSEAPGADLTVSRPVATFEMKDWAVQCEGDSWEGPVALTDTYQCELRLEPSNQLTFKVTPKSIAGSELQENGLSGTLQIRNGKPGLSLGLDDSDLMIEVDSDLHSGLFIRSHGMGGLQKVDFIEPYNGKMAPAYYFSFDVSPDWVDEAREVVAEYTLKTHDFAGKQYDKLGAWHAGDVFYRIRLAVYDQNNDGDEEFADFVVEFALDGPESIVVSKTKLIPRE